MSVGFTLSLVLEITNFKSFLRYLSLKFLMIPASNGWSLEVVFFWQKHDFDVGILPLMLNFQDSMVRYP